MKSLTESQARVLKILQRKNIMFTPGESIFEDNTLIHRKTIRHLKLKNLIDVFDMHPWGPWPTYGITLTDEGKEILKEKEI